MKLLKFACYIAWLTIILPGCHKENDDDTGGGGPGPDTPEVPVPGSDTEKSIFISSVERDASGFGVKALTVFDNNGTVRWKKMGRGYTADGYATYADGLLFSSEPGPAGSNLYAYDINTGNEVWSKTGFSEYFYYPIVRNDTLFCSSKINTSASGSITAMNARTGTFYWRKTIGNPYWPVHMVLDGGNLFYLITTSSVDMHVVSFNTNTQTVNWQSASTGINFASMVSNISVSGSRVVVKSGTKTLMAFDRTTGSTVWTVPGIPFEQPLVHSNTVFSVCSRDAYYPAADSLLGLYAFSETTGALKWKWKKAINYNGGSPYISGNAIFISGIKSDSVFTNETGFLNAFSLSTGSLLWSTVTGVQYENICTYPVAVGNRVYTFKNSSGAAGAMARIVRYDFVTGQPRDSISLAGESFGKVFVIGTSGKVYTTR